MSSIQSRLATDSYFRMGLYYQQQGDLQSAAECYVKSIEREPSAEAHTFLGWTLSLLGELDGAIEECRRAIEIDAQYGQALNDLGVYYMRGRRFDRALKYLTRATEAKNYDAHGIPHYNIALIHAQRDHLLRAIKSLKKSLKFNPSFTPALNLLKNLEIQIH